MTQPEIDTKKVSYLFLKINWDQVREAHLTLSSERLI